jgi:amino-acid N-acetyltransferase
MSTSEPQSTLPGSAASIAVRAADLRDLPVIERLMAPFVAKHELLARSEGALWNLLPQSFLAETGGRAVGFAALEVYSQKLSEIQCLSYDESPLGDAIITALLQKCVRQAQTHHIVEVMAIVPPRLEPIVTACGFHATLPGQKRAMFLRTGRRSSDTRTPDAHALSAEIVIRPTTNGDVAAAARFLAPFVARNELLPRSEDELLTLLRHGFVAEAAGRIVGFTALEVYSEKLAEVQCISVDEAYRRHGIGRRLVASCVACARRLGIAETLAISAREEVLRSCGFDDCLPGAKIALFVRNH